jgi:hypothetical protein
LHEEFEAAPCTGEYEPMSQAEHVCSEDAPTADEYVPELFKFHTE